MGKKNRSKHRDKQLMTLAVDLFHLCVQQPTRSEEWSHYLNIYNSVQDFEKRQKAATEINEEKVTKPRSELIPIFKEWLTENDVFYAGLEIKDYGDLDQGFGMIASKDIEMKDTLVTVPRKVMISSEKAKNSYLRDLIRSNEVLSVMPNVCLALFLHCEKYNPQSQFMPYINILPKTFNTTLYFTPDEMVHLKGSPNLSGAIQQYKSIVRQFSMIFQLFNGPNHRATTEQIPWSAKENFTFEAYRWAVSAVTTRQNKIPLEPVIAEDCTALDSTLALIPLWDLFNHDIGPMSTSYNGESQRLECFAMKDFQTGDQVVICYGGRPNSDLLIHNGFVRTDNPFDKVKISLGVSPKDPLFGKKAKLLQRLSIGVSGQFDICAVQSSLPTSPQIVAFLRVFLMDGDQLDHWLKQAATDLNELREVYTNPNQQDENRTPKDDAKMWGFLYNRVSLLLKGFGTNYKEEAELKLGNPALSFRSKLAIKLRMEEFKVLEACAKYCEELKNEPNITEKD